MSRPTLRQRTPIATTAGVGFRAVVRGEQVETKAIIYLSCGEGAGGVNRGGIPRTGLPTHEDTRICIVDSGSVRHGVKAYGREVVSLARSVWSSRFLDLLPNFVLHVGRKGPQDGRGGCGRLAQIAPVSILVGEWPAKGNVLYLGFGEACTHHQLSDAPRIGHGEGAWRLRVGWWNMSLGLQHPAHERESRVAFAGCPHGES